MKDCFPAISGMYHIRRTETIGIFDNDACGFFLKFEIEMKTLFSLIFYCLLMLPNLVKGQHEGIVMTNSTFEINPIVFKNANVRTLAYIEGREERISLIFDTSGKIIRRNENGGRKIIDSIFNSNNITVVKRFIHNKQAVEIDSVVIEKTYKKKGFVAFERITQRSYKCGERINSRNKNYNIHQQQNSNCYGFHYNNLANTTIHFGDQTLNQISISSLSKLPHLNIGRNFGSLKTNYNTSELYLTSEKVRYNNIKGGTKEMILKLRKKQASSYFVDGEVFSHNGCISDDNNFSFCGGYRNAEFDKFSLTLLHRNKRKLTDTAYIEYYPEQDIQTPCVKPNNVDCNFYLSNRSGVPKKNVLYIIRYEYFDE